MNNEQVIIPEGWTYYAHRTNTGRWQENPFNLESIITKKLMCTITEEDVKKEVSHFGNKRNSAYNFGGGEPFEIRTLICNLQYIRAMDDSNPMKDIMLKEFYFDRRNFGGVYGQRHPSIPKDEELVVIGIGNYDEVHEIEKKIIWTIPKRFIPFYTEEIKKNNNRVLDINLNEEIKKR